MIQSAKNDKGRECALYTRSEGGWLEPMLLDHHHEGANPNHQHD